MCLGWKEIEREFNRSRYTIRKWVKRYHLPLLRHPNRQPYLPRWLFEEWMVKMEKIKRRRTG